MLCTSFSKSLKPPTVLSRMKNVLDCVAEDDFEEAIEESLHVVAVDSGTWPTDGGGVATCRELVLDYVQHVRWSVLSEIGNDFKQVCFPVSQLITRTNLLCCLRARISLQP